eukprot:1947973-Ditylum_brightwellii.AAC.1
MKKRFEKQEERIDEKFKDISGTMEKNQESLLTAFQTQQSEVQDQLNQLAQSVMVIGNSMKKQQGQIDSLSKHQKANDDPSEGVKHARKEPNDLDNEYMDELEETVIETQPVGTPLQRSAPAPSAKRR